MLRLPVVSRSLFPAALTKGGAAATNNGKNLSLHQLVNWFCLRYVQYCSCISTQRPCCLCARTRTLFSEIHWWIMGRIRDSPASTFGARLLLAQYSQLQPVGVVSHYFVIPGNHFNIMCYKLWTIMLLIYLMIKVLSHPGHDHSKCYPVGSWTYFSSHPRSYLILFKAKKKIRSALKRFCLCLKFAPQLQQQQPPLTSWRCSWMGILSWWSQGPLCCR